MIDDKFISSWEKTLQGGKPKFIIQQFLRFFFILFIGNLLLTQFIFDGSSVLDYFKDSNWNGLFSRLGIWAVGCLVASYLQFWSYNKKYEKLKSGN